MIYLFTFSVVQWSQDMLYVKGLRRECIIKLELIRSFIFIFTMKDGVKQSPFCHHPLPYPQPKLGRNWMQYSTWREAG